MFDCFAYSHFKVSWIAWFSKLESALYFSIDVVGLLWYSDAELSFSTCSQSRLFWKILSWHKRSEFVKFRHKKPCTLLFKTQLSIFIPSPKCCYLSILSTIVMIQGWWADYCRYCRYSNPNPNPHVNYSCHG